MLNQKVVGVSLEVVDVTGRLVRTLGASRSRGAGGSGIVLWDGRDNMGRPCRSGIYYVRLNGMEGTEGRRAVVLTR